MTRVFQNNTATRETEDQDDDEESKYTVGPLYIMYTLVHVLCI